MSAKILGLMLFANISFSIPFPHNLYVALLIFSYIGLIEGILYALPSKGVIRFIEVWLLAIGLPPVWTGIGLALIFPGPRPFASADVLLPFLWIFCTLLLYAYSIVKSLLDTIQPRS